MRFTRVTHVKAQQALCLIAATLISWQLLSLICLSCYQSQGKYYRQYEWPYRIGETPTLLWNLSKRCIWMTWALRQATYTFEVARIEYKTRSWLSGITRYFGYLRLYHWRMGSMISWIVVVLWIEFKGTRQLIDSVSVGVISHNS